MKKSLNLLLVSILTVFTFTACNLKTEYKAKTIDSIVSIDIPTYMAYQDMENPEASLQYGNLLKEHYLMLMIETKAEIASYELGYDFTLESYADITLENFQAAVDNPELKKLSKMPRMINGMKSFPYEMRGEFEEINENIFYYITVLESDKAFYTIYSWCLEGGEKRFKNEMKIIAKSLKEI